MSRMKVGIMWHREYKDYPTDEPLVREQLKSGKGIVGCEMHDLNGWGNTLHVYRKKKKGIFRKFFEFLFGKKEEKSHG